MKKIICCMILGSIIGCSNQKPSDKVSSETKNTDPCTQFDKVDAEMLDVLSSIRQRFAEDRQFIERFNMSQVYWIQYRDRHLRAIYPKDWDRHYRKEYGKEVFNPCKCKELTRLAELRLEELKMYMTGGPKEQTECPSYWN